MARCLGYCAIGRRTALLIICVACGIFRFGPCGSSCLYADGLHGQTAVALLSTRATASTPQSLSDLQALEEQVQAAVEKTREATVSVRVDRQFDRSGFSGFAFGSGVIVSPDGYVMTAAHVSSRPHQRVAFFLANGRKANGVTLGTNQNLDMGLMKITDPGPWPYLERGHSQPVKAGDWCLAMGHPGGFEQQGPALVRLGRILKATPKVLLTDCTLVGGDSGGPLVDLQGNVIGIHSRIGADLTTNLHVPVDRYTESWDRLVDQEVWGNLVQSWIGVVHDSLASGVRIKAVHQRSPAERAGLRAGDLILQFADQRVSRFDELKRLVAQREPGKKVPIRVRRGDVTIDSLVEIGQKEWEDLHTRDDAELLKDWLDNIEHHRLRGRAITGIGKNSDQVKQAFHDALLTVSRSTVQVLSDGQVAALGTVVDQDGLILTKASQLGGELRCRVRGGKSFAVRLLGASRSYDLALLKADRSLPAVNFRSASTPKPGSLLASSSLNAWPLAVGVTSGPPVEIPSEGKLGIMMQSPVPRVTGVLQESAADKAGIRRGDLIVAIDDQPISTEAQVIEQIRRQYPGDMLQLTLRRDGALLQLRAQLGRDSELDEALAEFEDFIGGKLSQRRSGFPRVLQHDTALLPHECGGPVVDSQGRFVGLNIARAARTTSYLLPAADLQNVLAQLHAPRSDTLQVVGAESGP